MAKIALAMTVIFIYCGANAALAQSDMNITVTATHARCQVPPPADVPPPATPSTAAGNAAMANHDYALARANFKPLAESGNAEGARFYGILLMQDCTGLQDKEAGASWLQKAADLNELSSSSVLPI